jgi:hypothetical protein
MMNPKRMNWAMMGLNVVLLLAIVGVVFMGDSILKKQSNEIVAKKLEAAVLDKEQIALSQAKQDLERYAELKEIASQIVPQEKDQALTTRQIITLADKAGVKIGSVGFPSSSLGNNAKGTTPSAASGAISQAKPVAGINGLLALDIVVSSDNTRPSTYNQLVTFLASLENNRRTAQVSQISIQPDGKDPSKLNFNLTLTVYIKP